MKQKKIAYFWIGFVVSTAVTTWLYWLWRKSRVITPAPLIISRSETYQPVVKEVTANVTMADATVEEAHVTVAGPDKLEVIGGIGPATARRLNDAGVYTYEQLGKLSPEQLQKISGSNRWDPNDWIKQANELGNN
jgi:predicted flap endonuclease-1-like 5' DNA nuclease